MKSHVGSKGRWRGLANLTPKHLVQVFVASGYKKEDVQKMVTVCMEKGGVFELEKQEDGHEQKEERLGDDLYLSDPTSHDLNAIGGSRNQTGSLTVSYYYPFLILSVLLTGCDVVM